MGWTVSKAMPLDGSHHQEPTTPSGTISLPLMTPDTANEGTVTEVQQQDGKQVLAKQTDRQSKTANSFS